MQLADPPGKSGVSDAHYSHEVFDASGACDAPFASNALDPPYQPCVLVLLMYMMHLM